MGALISQLVFQPPKTSPLSAERRERLWLTTRHGIKIPVLFIALYLKIELRVFPQAFYVNRQFDITVLFSHGNAEDLGMIYDWFKSFSAVLRVNVLCYDYTGYGKSRDSVGAAQIVPSEESVYNDILAAYDFLHGKMGVPPNKVLSFR